jgi:2-polyprenyl-6-methoxyphenol hydroxylase-like FAD-dependent oxidoreductase
MRSAVVLGASIAGLLASSALARSFDRVTLVERDRLPDGPEPRKGVPQARHVHALLARGKLVIEELLPGFGAELAARAVEIHAGRDFGFLTPFGWAAPFEPALAVRSCSRDLLESIVRRRVRALPRVVLLDEHEIVGPVFDAAGGARGARVRARNDGTETVIDAELVVDATGRGSNADRWLESSFRGFRNSRGLVHAKLGRTRHDSWSRRGARSSKRGDHALEPAVCPARSTAEKIRFALEGRDAGGSRLARAA